ncbi:MAG: tRNA lysidine(34) synthetase TilS [Thiogranum sp.]|nr:tRNA lysidine(34) synthetase TilS [Thiogranum sp.]
MPSSRSKRDLQCSLDDLPAASAYWVAYSGGIDSHVLLHLLAERRDRLPGPLSAVHVDHRIQQQSGDWAIHCRAVCTELDVPFHLLTVSGSAGSGESPEAAARNARYRGLAEWLPNGAVLLTAQHRDDQAETLLLQLLRGAGPAGLAAMPARVQLGCGWLVRPWLSVPRSDIESYAHAERLRWVEDPSNTDLRYDRNLLRQRILPELRQRWPGMAGVLARAAAHQADQVEIAAALADSDYASCRDARRDCLNVTALTALSVARQRNLLRYWIKSNDLPVPSQVVLERVRCEVPGCRQDASPLVRWPGAELRRYRTRLFIMPPLSVQDRTERIAWQPPQSLHLESVDGELSVQPVVGQGWRMPDAGAAIEVRFRQGGETLRPAGRAHHQRLGHLFQDWGVPPWERDRVPLVYVDDKLAAVAGHCVTESFAACAGEPGYLLQWHRNA